IWTDGIRHQFIEEMGMMNIFCVIDGALITPPLGDTLLDGITRDSLLVLAMDEGLRIEERPVPVDELRAGLQSGNVTEVFGAGTAAVVAPIREIGIDGEDYPLPVVGETGGGATSARDSVAVRLKHQLDAIRYGREPDKYGWNEYIS
ncbi:MAG TPA: aminotransferase class IV, partial [Puia sp.]|nr:aminotransferase class IV [Puia sp.]